MLNEGASPLTNTYLRKHIFSFLNAFDRVKARRVHPDWNIDLKDMDPDISPDMLELVAGYFYRYFDCKGTPFFNTHNKPDAAGIFHLEIAHHFPVKQAQNLESPQGHHEPLLIRLNYLYETVNYVMLRKLVPDHRVVEFTLPMEIYERALRWIKSLNTQYDCMASSQGRAYFRDIYMCLNPESRLDELSRQSLNSLRALNISLTRYDLNKASSRLITALKLFKSDVDKMIGYKSLFRNLEVPFSTIKSEAKQRSFIFTLLELPRDYIFKSLNFQDMHDLGCLIEILNTVDDFKGREQLALLIGSVVSQRQSDEAIQPDAKKLKSII